MRLGLALAAALAGTAAQAGAAKTCAPVHTHPAVLPIVGMVAGDITTRRYRIVDEIIGEAQSMPAHYPYTLVAFDGAWRHIVSLVNQLDLPDRQRDRIVHTDLELAVRCWPKLAAAMRAVDQAAQETLARAERQRQRIAALPASPPPAPPPGPLGAYHGYWIPSETTCDDPYVHTDSYLRVKPGRIDRHESECTVRRVAPGAGGHRVEAVCEEAGNPPAPASIGLALAGGLLVETWGQTSTAYRRCSIDPDWAPPRPAAAASPGPSPKP